MKNPEVAKLESYCEEVWEPKTTLPAVKHKVALVLKGVAR